MKKLFSAALAALTLASCSPVAYTMYLQTRQPSESGVDMDGKTMAVVYIEDGSSRDSLFNNCVADGLASGLEKEYFGEDTAVDVFSIVSDQDYTSKDSLMRLLMDMDVDIVMMLDRPMFTGPSSETGRVKTTSHLYVYDSMSPRDEVYTLNATYNLKPQSLVDLDFGTEAQKVGTSFSKKFINTWEDDYFTVVYYEYGAWENGLAAAMDLKWDKAADIWLDLVASSKSPVAKSCAAYDLALACYMQKEYKLALEWLDQSDKLNPLTVSKNLRKRINDKFPTEKR